MFDKIFYINLDRRTDRNNNIKQELKRNGLENDEYEIVRIPAVDGSRLNLNKIPHNLITEKGINEYKNKDKNNKTGIRLTSGAIGCALSHKIVWEKILNENIQAALILEDDIHINKNFHHELDTYRKNLPNEIAKDYDIIFLGYHPATIKYIYKNTLNDPINGIYVKASRVYGLFGYIVTKQGAKKLIDIFPISQQIDTEISNYLTKKKLTAYLVKPGLRIITSEPSENAKEFGTDIQTINNYEEKFTLSKNKCNNSHSFLEKFIIIIIIIIYILFICITNDEVVEKQTTL
jgi:GR25 family glycosyltransferase involved in LPS biosynthesis